MSSVSFFFLFAVFCCECINPLRPILKEIEGTEGKNKNNLEFSIKTKLNHTFNTWGEIA